MIILLCIIEAFLIGLCVRRIRREDVNGRLSDENVAQEQLTLQLCSIAYVLFIIITILIV